LGGITLDPQTGAIKVNNRALRTKLSPPEHRILACLVEHKGELADRETLVAHGWPDAPSIDEHDFIVLEETMRELSAKLELLPDSGPRIEKEADRGYKLIDPTQGLHINIDEGRFQQQVQKIVDTDFFRGLEQRARDMRQTRTEH
jgi:DNA-binding response OmpR family regulator